MFHWVGQRARELKSVTTQFCAATLSGLVLQESLCHNRIIIVIHNNHNCKHGIINLLQLILVIIIIVLFIYYYYYYYSLSWNAYTVDHQQDNCSD